MKYITNKHISKKHISKNMTAPLLCMALCGVLTACGHKEPSHALSPEQAESQSTGAEPEIRIDTQEGSQSEQSSEHPIGSTAAPADSAQGEAGYLLIKDQTFDVTLEPLGSVTFASYKPDSLQNPLADVMFEIKKEKKKFAFWTACMRATHEVTRRLTRWRQYPFPTITAMVSMISSSYAATHRPPGQRQAQDILR